MRWLRFLALCGAIALVYLARALFLGLDPQSLAEQIPPWLRGPQVDALLGLLQGWSPEELRDLAWAAAGVGSLLFGMVAVPWPRHTAEPFEPPLRGAGAAWPLMGSALLLALGLAGYLWLRPEEPLWLSFLWGGGIFLFLGGAAALGTPRSVGDSREMPRPEAGWPLLLAMLLVAVGLLGWHLERLPFRVDGDPASHGLQALAIVSGQEPRLFAPGWANIPLLAYYPAAWGIRLVPDWLVGNRLAGVYAGLLTLVATWLLAGEIFRRRPQWNVQGVMEGDGRAVALMAVAFTGIGYTFIHFGRLPQYLEPVAWGTLALWALHRGLRTRDPLALGLGGVLTGLGMALYYSGRVYLVIGLLWWLWIGLLRPGWIRRRLGGLGWTAPAVWVGGLLVFLGPLLGQWIREPQSFLQRMQEVWLFGRESQAHMSGVYGVEGALALFLESLKRAAFTFNFYPDTSTHFGWRGPMLDDLTGPLLLLGLGLVVLNLDRLQSWLLLSGFLATVVLGGGVTINAPFWPRLLPALPLAGMLTALAVDRIRRTLVESMGAWVDATFTSVLIGFLVLAGLRNFVDYADQYSVFTDNSTSLGRALRQMHPEQTAWVLTPESGPPPWDERVVDFLTGTPYTQRSWRRVTPETLPDRLPPDVVILVLPEHQGFLADLQSRYPGGEIRYLRTRRGDPYIYLYALRSSAMVQSSPLAPSHPRGQSSPSAGQSAPG